MHRKTLFICSMLVISLIYAHAEEPQKLAHDDIYSYNTADVKGLVQVDELPFRSILTDALVNKDPKSIERLKSLIKSYAFKRLFVYDRLKTNPLPDSTEYQIREVLRAKAFDRFMAQITSECRVTTDELTAVYEARKDSFKTPERRKISVLYKVFPADPSLKQAVIQQLEDLRAKPDFSEHFLDYVKQNSDLPGALQGGVVDYFTSGTYGPTVEHYAFRTPKGEVSPVFSAKSGAYIITCLDIKPAGYLPISETNIYADLYRQKFASLVDNRIESLKKEYSPAVPSDISSSMPGKTVLLKVDDYTLTSSTLSSAYPELFSNAADMERIKEYLEDVSIKEIILQDYLKYMKSMPESPEYYEFTVYKTNLYYAWLFSDYSNAKVSIEEKEIKDYYSKYKEYYHANTPKILGYVLFSFPEKKSMTEPEYYKHVVAQRRKARAFLKSIESDPERFVEEAQKLADANDDIAYKKTSMIEDFPAEWGMTKSIREFNVGMISPAYDTDNGVVVFKVLEAGKPRILPLEEVRDKVSRVIYGMKQGVLRAELLEHLLQKYHFEFTF